MAKKWGPINCLVTDILQNIFFCVQLKIEIHTGLEQLEGQEMTLEEKEIASILFRAPN